MFEVLRRDFTGVAASKGLRLSVDAPRAFVHSDPALIGQVLRNLLSNAIKYTQQGSVELRCIRHDKLLRLEVRDTGVGIAADQIGLIFDEFYQIGVSPNSSRDGYGLGLSIVQRITRILGIHVDVTSEPGRGSAFSFRLPSASLAAPVDATHAAREEPGLDAGDAELLLVEDEPGVRNAMRMLLKLEGYRVTAAATAQEALDRLRRGEHYDLIVTDYHLDGGRTGTQIIAAAREMNGAGLKAILVTGDTSSAVREMQGDANLRITSKPINSSELIALVKGLLA